MKKINEIKTEIYKSGSYYIEISTTKKEIGAWIWNKDYGVKMHMWSEPIEQTNYSEFFMTVCKTISEYKKTYQEEYED